MTANGGIFITFEGGEGVGKTTQIKLLAQRLESEGRTVLTTLEPGGTLLGKTLRRLLVSVTEDQPSPRAELMLYCADRAQHVDKVISPALLRGEVVLCDRFVDATVAYQGFGRGLDVDLINDLNRMATGGLLPHRTLWLDADPGKGIARSLERMAGQGCDETRFEDEKIEFHQRVRKGYEVRQAADPSRMRKVEADRPIGEVEVSIWREVRDLFE